MPLNIVIKKEMKMEKNMPKLMVRVLLPTVIGAVIFGQLMAVGKIIPKLFLINFIVAFIGASVVLALLPLNKIGGYLVVKKKMDPKGLKFEIVINCIINIFFALIIGILIITVNLCIINKLPFSAVIQEFLKSLIPTYIVTTIISFFAFRIHNNIEMKSKMARG